MMTPASDVADVGTDAKDTNAIKSTGDKTSLSEQHGLKWTSALCSDAGKGSLRPNDSRWVG